MRPMPEDWRVTAGVDRAELLNLIARLEAYHRDGKATCIVSASTREEAIERGLEHLARNGLPRDMIRLTNAYHAYGRRRGRPPRSRRREAADGEMIQKTAAGDGLSRLPEPGGGKAVEEAREIEP